MGLPLAFGTLLQQYTFMDNLYLNRRVPFGTGVLLFVCSEILCHAASRDSTNLKLFF